MWLVNNHVPVWCFSCQAQRSCKSHKLTSENMFLITSLTQSSVPHGLLSLVIGQKNTTKQKSTGILLDATMYRDRGWGLNSTSKCYASIPWQARPSTLSRTLWNSLLVLPWIQWLQFWCNVQNKTELLVYIMCRYFDALRSPSVQIWTYPSGAAMKTTLLRDWETVGVFKALE